MSITAIAIGAALLCAPPQARLAEDKELKRLVEQVAKGDAADSEDASRRLIERFIGPIGEALGSLESRPPAEQVRVYRLVSRLSANLRIRLVRADLAPEDRRLFDEFLSYNPELVEQLFDDDARIREAAVARIPREPDTGAGVLLVAKIVDADEAVSTAAFNAAGELGDAVVARGLARFIEKITAAIRNEQFGPGEQEVAMGLAACVGEAVKLLGKMGHVESVPAIVEAVRFYTPGRFRLFFLTTPSGMSAETNDVIAALGRIGDARGAEALVELLDDKEVWGNKGLNGKLLTQTIGDAALLALLQIYRLDPKDFGFHINPETGISAGFFDESAREESRRKFREWRRQHASSQPTTQAAPAVQPPSRTQPGP